MSQDRSGVLGRSDMTEVVVPLGEPTTVECNSDLSPVGYKTAPGGAGTPTEGLTDPFTQTEGMAAMQSIEAPPAELAERALTMLSVLRKQQETTRLHRVFYMKLARNYGCSYADIGESLGMTESGARKFLERADTQ